MAEIIARYADGRLLVQEDKACEERYDRTAGVPFRIGHLRTVEKVVSIDAYMSGYPGADGSVLAPLREVTTSGANILIKLRRQDIPQFLSSFMSGITDTRSYGVLSGLTSGQGILGELLSGNINISGRLKILANVIGF